MTCEDYPCCGHEPGGCPTINEAGEQVFPCACCGYPLPVHSPSAVCGECHQRHLDEEDGNVDDCDCDEESEQLPGEDMDGDAESALASAGHGTDEDYSWDTPLGDEYGGE